MLIYWLRFHQTRLPINTQTNDITLAGHFLHLLLDIPPKPLEVHALNVSLILYAKHEFNASTFAARVCALTRSDIYSALVTGIGTLKGPLHGGANEAVMEFLQKIIHYTRSGAH